MSAIDENDKLRAGTLPKDAKSDTKVVAQEALRVHTVRELLEGSMLRVLSRDKPDTLTTGHYRLDKITGGFRRGFCWVLGADTSWGKSSFLVSVVDENIQLGKKMLIVSVEDTEEVYGDRLLARRSRVSANNIRERTLTSDEMTAVARVAQAGEPVPVFVFAKGRPIEDLLPELQKAITEYGIQFVAFDYLTEFETKRRFQDERVKFKYIASNMRTLVKRNDITGIIFSQLTITSDTKIPNRQNIRDCRDVASGADVIILGFEPEVDVLDKDKRVVVPAGTKCIFVDKVKNGPKGAKVLMRWNEHSACFDMVPDPELVRIQQMAAEYDDQFERMYP